MAIVAAAGQRVLVGKMASQKLATIAAAGLVVIGALPGAAAALAALPLLRRLARALPRPRALGATGFLLSALAVVGRAGVRLRAVARRLAGARPRAALRARGGARARQGARPLLVLVAAGSGAPGAAPGAVVGLALPLAVAVAAMPAVWRSASRLPEGAPAFEAVADHGWGLRFLLATARRLTDHDGDGFSARFGGGDCDDTRADVYPGAEDIPGDGIDQDCEGGDAKPVAAAAKSAGDRTARRRGAGADQAARRTAGRGTSSSSPSTPSAPTGWASPGTADRPAAR